MIRALALIFLLLWLPASAFGEERFPPPEFDNHNIPEMTQPGPKSAAREYADVAVLVLCLSLASWLAVKRRSRRGLFVLMAFSLLYFGFWKKGCVCSIGAIGNVTLALSDPTYLVSYPILLFFFLPLLVTLFYGRTFCASVCPFGALQDLFLLKPVRVPEWLEHGLGLLPFVYLGAAVLLAATGSALLICQYDPFVAFFRLDGSLSMLVLGASLIVLGLFVGRAYCRYVCPYGAILGLFSRLAKRHVAITPNHCIDCNLCNDACPFGAILPPTPKRGGAPRVAGKGTLVALLILLPLLILAGAWAGSALNVPLSRMNATVRQAERVQLEESGAVKDPNDLSDAFRKTGLPPKTLYAEALRVRQQFALGGALFGAFVGLVVGLKLVRLALRRRRTDYEIVRANCVACGRCFEFCPKERALRMPATVQAASSVEVRSS